MRVNDYNSSLNYLTFEDWSNIWATRGYMPKNRRTEETAKNGHRALSKPIMTGERLTYDEEKGCFRLHWWVSASNTLDQSNTAFECYPHMWKIYPVKEKHAGWNTRGTISRINKYVPLNAYMYTSKGSVLCKGLGEITEDGVIITESSQLQRMQNTTQAVNEGIYYALNMGSYGTPSTNSYTRRKAHRGSNDLNYTREKLCNILDGYIGCHIEEILLRSVFLAEHAGRKGECTLQSYYTTGIGTPKDSPSFFLHNIVQEREDGEPGNFVFLEHQPNGAFLEYDLAGLFGIYKCKQSGVHEYYHNSGSSDVSRYPYNRIFTMADSTASFGSGAVSFVKHMLSFFYDNNIQLPIQRQRETEESGMSTYVPISGSYGLFFLCNVMFATKGMHDFKTMVHLLLGEKVYKYIRGSLPHKNLESAIRYMAGDPATPKVPAPILMNIIRRIYNVRMVHLFSQHICPGGHDLRNIANRKMHQYRKIMRDMLVPLINIGVDYNQFGITPYMAHVSMSGRNTDYLDDQQTVYAVNLLTNSGSHPSNRNQSVHSEHNCTTSLMSIDSIMEENPLRCVEGASALVISGLGAKEDACRRWSNAVLDSAYNEEQID